jgi:hypothetical protein
MSVLTLARPTTRQEQVTEVDRLAAENRGLPAELNRQQTQLQQVQAAFEAAVAEQRRLAAQAVITQLVNENEQLSLDLTEFKGASFKSRRRAWSPQPTSTASGWGRPAGHPG